MADNNASRIYRSMRGRCVGCGLNKPTEGSRYCDECRRKNRERMRDVREERKQNGLCIRCGKSWRGEYAACDECREKGRAALRKFKEKRGEHERTGSL